MKGILGGFIIGKKNFIIKLKLTKFCILLLIFLCVSLETTCAYPPRTDTTPGWKLVLHTPAYKENYHQQLLQQHHRSFIRPVVHYRQLREASTMSLRNSEKCSNFVKILTDAKNETILSYNETLRNLPKYTQNQFNYEPHKVLNLYSLHSVSSRHPLGPRLKYAFNETVQVNEDLSSVESVKKLIVNIYETFMILNNTYNRVLENYENPLKEKTQEQKAIHEFLQTAKNMANRCLDHSKSLAKALDPDQELPENKNLLSLNDELATEWILIKEHLSSLQYLMAVYDSLINKCGTKHN